VVFTLTSFGMLVKSHSCFGGWLISCGSMFLNSCCSSVVRNVTLSGNGGTEEFFAGFRALSGMFQTPGVSVIKLFSFVADGKAKLARVFVPGYHFPV
jgi:hypothetical protein